jgi:hypothetical protein
MCQTNHKMGGLRGSDIGRRIGFGWERWSAEEDSWIDGSRSRSKAALDCRRVGKGRRRVYETTVGSHMDNLTVGCPITQSFHEIDGLLVRGRSPTPMVICMSRASGSEDALPSSAASIR